MLATALQSLPGPRTSLIGRERELNGICELIACGAERLVTLTGVGGGGKTRLALEAARRLREAFPDGVWLVELAELSNPRLVAARVAAALALRKSSDHMLATALQARRLLLVLDNCEHLIDACASSCDQLLTGCPDLRILATSREPLLIDGERQWRVLPLATPPAGIPESVDAAAQYPAVQLFVVRAVAASPGFELGVDNAADIGRICRLVAGIPLAIELAAAQVRALSTAQIKARLDQSFQMRGGARRMNCVAN